MKMLLDSTLAPPVHIAEVDERTEKDDALFRELASVLDKYGAIDRFGISLLHRHFELEHGEILLETTDVAGRLQTVQPVVADTIAGMPFIETAWRLGDGWVAMACICVRDSAGKHDSHQSRG